MNRNQLFNEASLLRICAVLMVLLFAIKVSGQQVTNPTSMTKDIRYQMEERNDCAVLACMVAFDVSYISAWRSLDNLEIREPKTGVQLHKLSANMHKLADRMDALVLPMIVSSNGQTVSDIAKTYTDGVFLVVVDGHILAVEDGVVHDTSRRSLQKEVRAAWIVVREAEPLHSYTY